MSVCVHMSVEAHGWQQESIYCAPLYLGEMRQGLRWSWSSQIWPTQLCSFLIVCAAYAQLQEIFCSIAFPLLPHLVFYTSENSATVSAVIQGRDSRVIFFSFLSPPKSNKSASLLVPLPERTCSIPTAPLLPPPPHPLMSHSRPALLPWLASCNLLSMQESGKSL